MEERRKAWFTNKGQIVMSVTLFLQLLVIAYGAGKLVNSVELLQDQVHAMTQRIARIEDLYFRK